MDVQGLNRPELVGLLAAPRRPCRRRRSTPSVSSAPRAWSRTLGGRARAGRAVGAHSGSVIERLQSRVKDSACRRARRNRRSSAASSDAEPAVSRRSRQVEAGVVRERPPGQRAQPEPAAADVALDAVGLGLGGDHVLRGSPPSARGGRRASASRRSPAGVRTMRSLTPSEPSKRSSQASPTEMSASSARASGQKRQRGGDEGGDVPVEVVGVVAPPDPSVARLEAHAAGPAGSAVGDARRARGLEPGLPRGHLGRARLVGQAAEDAEPEDDALAQPSGAALREPQPLDVAGQADEDVAPGLVEHRAQQRVDGDHVVLGAAAGGDLLRRAADDADGGQGVAPRSCPRPARRRRGPPRARPASSAVATPPDAPAWRTADPTPSRTRACARGRGSRGRRAGVALAPPRARREVETRSRAASTQTPQSVQQPWSTESR